VFASCRNNTTSTGKSLRDLGRLRRADSAPFPYVVPCPCRKINREQASLPDTSGIRGDHRNQVVSLQCFINILLSDVHLSMFSATKHGVQRTWRKSAGFGIIL
jgi:hypothetical protein